MPLTLHMHIQNDKSVYHIIEPYVFQVKAYQPHYEIVIMFSSYPDFNNGYFDIINKLREENLAYVLDEHIEIPKPKIKK